METYFRDVFKLNLEPVSIYHEIDRVVNRIPWGEYVRYADYGRCVMRYYTGRVVFREFGCNIYRIYVDVNEFSRTTGFDRFVTRESCRNQFFAAVAIIDLMVKDRHKAHEYLYTIAQRLVHRLPKDPRGSKLQRLNEYLAKRDMKLDFTYDVIVTGRGEKQYIAKAGIPGVGEAVALDVSKQKARNRVAEKIYDMLT